MALSFIVSVIVSISVSNLFSVSPASNIESDRTNVRFYFELSPYFEGNLTSEDRDIMLEWQDSIIRAGSLLPDRFVRDISVSDYSDSRCRRNIMVGPGQNCIRQVKFSFFVDDKSWVTGYPGQINLRPSPVNIPDWMTWEPFPKDGYSQEERLWVALHEMAHSYDLGTKNYSSEFYKIEESPTTLYGCTGGSVEDFGEAFSLYVMFPEQLKKFPGHYRLIKEILGREYSDYYEMPNSIRSKLVDPQKGCGEHIGRTDYSNPTFTR